MANTHEHLEHAEHAAHHAPDGFAQKVAVSMAIIAAVLAGLSMIGHRTHNKVLMLQGEANRLQGEANRIKTEATAAEVEKSNLFAWYQAKRQRQSVYQVQIASAKIQTVESKADRDKAIADWKKKADEYDDPADPDSLPNIRKKGDAAGTKAKDLHAKADKVTAQADQVKDDAGHVHHQADRLDIAHLLAEIGLVICSVAVLTRKKAFWYAGILAAVLAIGTGVSAYMIPHHPHEADASHSEKH
jgi:hypothetical protein